MQPWGGLANDGEFPRNGDGHFVRVRWDVVGRHFAAGPAHLKLRGRLGCAHHLHGAVLRPITRAGVNFARGTGSRPMHEAQDGADARRIARRPVQPHAQAGPGAFIALELGLGSVLRHGEVNTTVPVVVAERGAAAFAVNAHTAVLSGHGFEPAPAIAHEPHT